MTAYTIEQYKNAARKAKAAGNLKAAEELAQAGIALQSNPEGTGIGRAIKRGAVQTAAAPFTLAATADVRALGDIGKSEDAIRYDEAIRAGVPTQAFASRAANISDPRQVNSMMQQYGVSPAANVNYQQVVDKRLERREEAAKNPEEYLKRLSENSATAGRLFKLADSFARSPTADAYAKSLAEAPDGFKGWLSTVTDDPLGFMAFMGETIAESAPQIGAGLATSVVTGSPVAGAGVMSLGGLSREYANEVNSFLKENGIDLSDPESAKKLFSSPELMDKANERGVTRGLVIAAADFAGQGLVAQQIIRKSLKRQAVAQGGSEGAGEALATKAVGDAFSFKETITEALAGTGSTIGEAAVAKTLFNKDGKLASADDLSTLPISEKLAAADVARMLDEISKANGYKLKNVDPSSNKGAKQTLEDARSSNVQAINDLKKVLKKQLDPKNAQSLEELLSVYSEAAAGIGAGKKKVSQRVTVSQLQALEGLVGDTKEGQQLLQELLKSNVITDLFKDGMKGGVSQFTDLFNPISHSGAVYDPTRYANVFVGGASAYGTGGLSLGIAAGGRVVDFFTGRRSKVAKFVNDNKKDLGLPAPEGTSLIEQKNKQKAAAKDRRLAVAKIAQLTNAPSSDYLANILAGTGLDRDGLNTVLKDMGEKFGSDPNFKSIIDDVAAQLEGKGTDFLDVLTEFIPVVGHHAQLYFPDLVVSAPDNLLLKRSFDSPNVQTDMPNMGGGGANTDTSPQFGTPEFTTQENYNRGIEANRQAAIALSRRAQIDPELSVQDKAVVATALDQLQFNLGSDPSINAQAIFDQVAQNVNEDVAVKYIKPYVDRVVRQQRPKGLQAAVDAGAAPNPNTALEKLRKAQGDIKEATQNTNYDQALKIVNEERKASPSYLQRKMGIKRNEAVALIERLEAEGIVSEANHVGRRFINEEALQNAVNRDSDDNLSQTLDLQSLSPKKPQAPTLEASEIPTETRKAYKLMKVQPTRLVMVGNKVTHELLPLYAKDGEDGKGSPSGFQLNTWHKAEMQRPMIGGKLLAKRGGIHALNLPVFDQGKAKVKGQQRVWVEVEIPTISPDTQLESDTSPLINNNIREGIKNRLIGTKESYDYKTNPNASNDAGGWPIAGSMRALRIVPDNEIAQILRDNGLDHQIDNSFTDVNEAKAQELMGTPEAETDLLSQQSPILNREQNPLNIDQNDLQSTNVDIMPTSEEIEVMRNEPKKYKPEQKRTLVEAVDYLNKRWQKATGRTEPFEYTPENVDRISSLMATEAMQALKNDGNAIGWYDRKLKAAKAVVSLVDPRVTQSPDAEAAFDFALAVTSNGQAVADNFEYALEVFRHFMDNGVMPTDTWIKGGERNEGMVQAFEFFNAYNASGSNMPIQEFLDTDFTVRDLKEWATGFNQREGTNIKVPSSEGQNEMVKGSFVVGAKIGQGFYQNIRGNYDPLTMDIWWMRMWNRLVGRPFEASKDLNKNRIAVRNSLKSKNQDNLEKRLTNQTLKELGIKRSDLKNDETLDTFVNKLESNYQSFFRKRSAELKGTGKKVEKPQLFKSTGTMVKNMVPQLQAQPKSSSERSYMRTVTAAAIEKLRQNGYMITTADFQALMWYPEKQLFRKLGVAAGRGADNDYLDAAIMLAEKEGFTNDQINQALPSSDRDGTVNSQPNTEGQDVSGDRGAGRDGAETPRLSQGILSRLSTGATNLVSAPTQREFDFGRTLPTDQEFKSQTKLANVPFEVGLKGGKFENGLKDYMNLKRLADAYMITLSAYNDFDAMVKGSKNAGKGTRGLFNQKNREAKYLIAGTKMPDGEAVGANSAFITAIHELAHGIASADPEGWAGGTGAGMRSDYLKPVKRFNYLNMRNDQTYKGTFEDEVAKLLDIPDAEKQEVISEIINLQDNVNYLFEGGGEQEVRDLQKAKNVIGNIAESLDNPVEQEAYLRKMAPLVAKHQQYVRGVYEMSVEPIIYYLYDPKAFKKLAPKSAKLVQKFFKESSIIRFYNHPLALGVAVVLAMMMKQEQADEEDQQQGILAQQQAMQAGALTA